MSFDGAAQDIWNVVQILQDARKRRYVAFFEVTLKGIQIESFRSFIPWFDVELINAEPVITLAYTIEWSIHAAAIFGNSIPLPILCFGGNEHV